MAKEALIVVEPNDEQLTAVVQSLRALAAAFADPYLAPSDAGVEGVAVRPPSRPGGEWVVALVTRSGAKVEFPITAERMLSPELPGVAHALFERLAQQEGEHSVTKRCGGAAEGVAGWMQPRIVRSY